MKINPVDMMHSLSNYSYEYLLDIAENECISISKRPSKIELICIIITERVNRAAHSNDYSATKDSGRKKYQITTVDNESYYVKLTPEQVKFLDWCLDAEICFSDANAHELDDIEWETP